MSELHTWVPGDGPETYTNAIPPLQPYGELHRPETYTPVESSTTFHPATGIAWINPITSDGLWWNPPPLPVPQPQYFPPWNPPAPWPVPDWGRVVWLPFVIPHWSPVTYCGDTVH